MRPRSLLVSIIAVGVVINLVRFPYLSMENGGGAFLILFLLSLFLVALPVLIAETTLNNKLANLDWSRVLLISPEPRKMRYLRILGTLWFQLIVVLCFLGFVFFLCMSRDSFFRFVILVKHFMSIKGETSDLPTFISLDPSFGLSVLFIGVFAGLFHFFKRYFVQLCTHMLLPLATCLIMVIGLQIIFSLDRSEGLKTLFYPDFHALKPSALISAVGHSFALLLVGFGFFDVAAIREKHYDPIEILNQGVVNALLITLFVGVMALPLVEEARIQPYGDQWMFGILPRWIFYGTYGYYYCAAYFLSISVLTFYMSVLFLHLVQHRCLKLFRRFTQQRWRKPLLVLFYLGIAGLLTFLHPRLEGWQGQAISIKVDTIVYNILLPMLAFIVVFLSFTLTSESERRAVFAKQNVFFHSEILFKMWTAVIRYLVPATIVLGWLVWLLSS